MATVSQLEAIMHNSSMLTLYEAAGYSVHIGSSPNFQHAQNLPPPTITS